MQHEREPHPAPAATDRYGQRLPTPQPDPTAIVRNFGRPHTAPAEPPASEGER